MTPSQQELDQIINMHEELCKKMDCHKTRTDGLLMDYEELFDILNLDLLPGEEQNFDPFSDAVVDYYETILNYYSENSEEYNTAVNHLRKLLIDLSTFKTDFYCDVWKAIAEIEDNYSFLRISVPLIKYMWI
jgi:hypothetical protein